MSKRETIQIWTFQEVMSNLVCKESLTHLSSLLTQSICGVKYRVIIVLKRFFEKNNIYKYVKTRVRDEVKKGYLLVKLPKVYIKNKVTQDLLKHNNKITHT